MPDPITDEYNKYHKNETIYIPESEIYQCNFCGAYTYSKDPNKINHHLTCTRPKNIKQ